MPLFRTRTQTVVAVQFDGTNEDEVRELLDSPVGPVRTSPRPFPPVGHWVVVRSGGVSVYSPADFASNYEPLL